MHSILDADLENGVTQAHSPPKVYMKGKGKLVTEESSSDTPVEQVLPKVSSSSRPWSKVFLGKAKKNKKEAVMEDPATGRSTRVQNLKK